MYCTKCGKQVEETNMFCPNCGAPQPETASAQVTTPARQSLGDSSDAPYQGTFPMPPLEANPFEASYPSAANPYPAFPQAPPKNHGGAATGYAYSTARKTMPLYAKVIAGVVAAAIVIGGGTTVWLLSNRNLRNPAQSPSIREPSIVPSQSTPPTIPQPSNSPPQSQPQKVKGIITFSYDGDFPNTERPLVLTAIDPETGKTTEFATFSIPIGYGIFIIDRIFNASGIPSFDAEYERVSVYAMTYANTNMGWIDRSGTFTDVAAAVLPPPDDFSEAIYVNDGVFGADGYYYYREYNFSAGFGGPGSRNNIKLKRVPVSDMALENVELLSEPAVIPRNDGSVFLYYCDTGVWNEKLSFSDASLQIHNNQYNKLGGWISANEFVASDDYGIYVNQGRLVSEAVSAQLFNLKDGRVLVPPVDGLLSWSPIISPDRMTVAFLHTTQNGEAGLYTIPASGGTPTKIPTSYNFIMGKILIDWISDSK